ncbi:lytic polysaccharide monooxygenase, partial [Amniculicola lignicola CBS 123094]
MAPLSFLRPLCTLFIITPLILAHMQMEEPSPLRDPHSKRAAEPKDFNILTPLKGDGSDFSCKGYQWNTPLTPVRTYYAGETYEMRLRGGATHGGGSCQIGLSCDEGRNFKVLKSIIGGCPIQKEYEFTIPEYAVDGLCFLSWTWFNRIGNREMYMNCAVVNIRGAEYKKRMKRREDDSASVGSAAAQAALSDLPDLYVANLKGVNNCQTKETVDLVFDDPGNDVIYNKG